MFRLVGESAEERQQKATAEALKKTLKESRRERTRENAALILAEFAEKDDEAVGILKKMMEEGKSPWRSARSAIGLARLRDVSGWQYVTQQLEAGAYPAAALLAEQRRRGLEQLAEKVGQAAHVEQLAQNVKRVIERAIEKGTPRNRFEERYAKHLVACFDRDCGVGTSSGAVGGECTIGK
jgi:hypothetical protein